MNTDFLAIFHLRATVIVTTFKLTARTKQYKCGSTEVPPSLFAYVAQRPKYVMALPAVFVPLSIACDNAETSA